MVAAAQSTTNVTVNAGPTANATSNSPVCVGGDINLSTPSAGTGATYSWTGPNGFSSTSRQPTNVNVGTGDAGNYTVTVTLNVAAAKVLLMLPSMQDPLQMLPATVLCAWVVTSIFQLQVRYGATYSWTGRMDLALLQDNQQNGNVGNR
jgi:hypothetical protein